MKITLILCLLLVVIVFMSGCTTVQKADDSGATAEGVNSVVDANNDFAFDMYTKVKSDTENVFFSPYSISTALAITYEGARGQTAEEIQTVFHFPKDDNVRRPSFARIYNQLNAGSNDYQLSTANALWAQKDYPFLEDYIKSAENYYGGKVTNLDFIGETEKSRVTINDWIEQQTRNKIKDLIPQGVLSDYTRLVITNAIYFKGFWTNKFDPKDTGEEDFKLSNGNDVKVPMMRLTDSELKFKYTETEDLQVLEMPYKGEELSMIILLPKEGKMGDLENSISSEKLTEWKNALRNETVHISLPKFKFETKYFLVDTLKEMGMPVAFSSSDADFSGMNGKRDLFIQNVIHQAFVEVNEEGTEAAAATAVVVNTMSIPSIKDFRADHPFIFIIQDKSTGNVLFLGKVNDPR